MNIDYREALRALSSDEIPEEWGDTANAPEIAGLVNRSPDTVRGRLTALRRSGIVRSKQVRTDSGKRQYVYCLKDIFNVCKSNGGFL